jgi:predicted N-acetyltransferase YhbS
MTVVEYSGPAMVDFKLRPMEPADGPAMDALMRDEAQTTSVSMTTHYRYDIHAALAAQHPTLFGVVAETPGLDGLVGVATAFLDEVRVAGRVFPCAHLENLKVHHDVRRQGLGAQLAAWRIDEAHRIFGDEGVVTAGVESTNMASLATARHWSTQVLGPVRIVIARTSSKRPTSRDVEVRPLEEGDIEAVVDGLAAFYADYDMVPRQTPTRFARALAPTVLGEPIRAYRVAVTKGGTLIAGAGITERFKLMTDHIDAIPLPIAILGRITGFLPADRIIRSVEVGLAWHAPGRVDAAHAVWDAIRFEWRDRANTVVGLADPRGSLIEAFHVGRSFVPRIELVAPVKSPVRLDPDRLLYMWR